MTHIDEEARYRSRADEAREKASTLARASVIWQSIANERGDELAQMLAEMTSAAATLYAEWGRRFAAAGAEKGSQNAHE